MSTVDDTKVEIGIAGDRPTVRLTASQTAYGGPPRQSQESQPDGHRSLTLPVRWSDNNCHTGENSVTCSSRDKDASLLIHRQGFIDTVEEWKSFGTPVAKSLSQYLEPERAQGHQFFEEQSK